MEVDDSKNEDESKDEIPDTVWEEVDKDIIDAAYNEVTKDEEENNEEEQEEEPAAASSPSSRRQKATRAASSRGRRGGKRGK